MKICPNCASENIDWITPIDSTLWICKACGYIGTAIDGNEELIQEIKENYIEELKEEEETNETEEKNESSLKDTFKICSRCGSDSIGQVLSEILPIQYCKTCGYRGPFIEGNEELIREIRGNYIEKLKEERYNNEKEEDIRKKFDRLSTEDLEKINKIEGKVSVKICPKCGSDNIDWQTPNDKSIWLCETCGYRGFLIEGNENFIREIRESYMEKLKEEENIHETEQENESFIKDTIKICPKCGSDNINWVIPQLWSIWQCNTCGFRGLIIEGDEKLIREIRKSYIENLKGKKEISENDQENEVFEDELNDEELEKKLDEIIGTDFDSYISQNDTITSKKEEELLEGVDSNIVEIYEKLKKEILTWNKKIKFKPKKDYLTFSYDSRFLKLCLDKDKINLQLSFSESKPFDDYKDITEEILENENDELIRLTFSLNSYDDVEYSLFLIKQSYENNKKNNLDSFLAKIFPQSKYY